MEPTSARIASTIVEIEALTRAGSLTAAEAKARELVQLHQGEHSAWAWLGMLALVQGRGAEAEESLRRAISLFAGDAHYWTNLAMALRCQGSAVDGETCARQAVALDSSSAAHWVGLGGCLYDQQRWDEAAATLAQAIACDPKHAEAWSQLGMTEQWRGRLDAAQAAYERAIGLGSSTDVETAAKYGSLLVVRGKREQGMSLLRELVRQAPLVSMAWLALGNAHRFLAELPEAESAFRRAVALDPQGRPARHNLALVLLARSATSESLAITRTLLQEHPEFANGWMLMGSIQNVRAQSADAVFALQRAMAISPGPSVHSSLLFMRQFSDLSTPEQLLEEHRKWDETYARPFMPAVPPGERRGGHEPLRLGFVAFDFKMAPTGFLALNAFERLSKEFSLVCYSDGVTEDDYTRRFQSAAALWRPTSGLTDDELAEQVRRDEVDVLFDLMGHAGARPLVFARKPAAVQVTWLGYVGTTGLTAMDYLLADRFHVRNGEESWYSESVLRMPHSYICYSPQLAAPDVVKLPVLDSGRFTFGCFNNPAKYSRRMIEAWAQILSRVPNSRLLLKYYALADEGFQVWLREQFGQLGVGDDRIIMEGPCPQPEILASYGRVDLALDTQPYSGGLTTCEALWMGVPVVTYPGRTFAGRHSSSHLANAGYEQFVAADLPGYVELAIQWASRIDELAALRAAMRQQVQRSPLCDAARFAEDFSVVIRRAWAAKASSR